MYQKPSINAYIKHCKTGNIDLNRYVYFILVSLQVAVILYFLDYISMNDSTKIRHRLLVFVSESLLMKHRKLLFGNLVVVDKFD